MSEIKKQFIEKRKGPDLWVRMLSWISIAGWAVFFIIINIVTLAKPQVENFFHKFMHARLRKTWDMDLAQYAFYLMVFLLIFSMFGFIVNIKRCRRKSDRFRASIVIMIFSSIIGILSYIFFL